MSHSDMIIAVILSIIIINALIWLGAFIFTGLLFIGGIVVVVILCKVMPVVGIPLAIILVIVLLHEDGLDDWLL